MWESLKVFFSLSFSPSQSCLSLMAQSRSSLFEFFSAPTGFFFFLSLFFLPASEDSDRSLIFVYFMSLLAIYNEYFLALSLSLLFPFFGRWFLWRQHRRSYISTHTVREMRCRAAYEIFKSFSFFSSLPPPHLFVPPVSFASEIAFSSAPWVMEARTDGRPCSTLYGNGYSSLFRI